MVKAINLINKLNIAVKSLFNILMKIFKNGKTNLNHNLIKNYDSL